MSHSALSSVAGRGLLAACRLPIFLAALSLAAACGSNSPASPGPTPPAPSANVSIVSMAVSAETLGSGARTYRVTVKMRESGGVAATVTAIDLTFMSGSSTVTSSHEDHPISDAANVIAASATVDSRELVTMDTDASHPHATSVVARVTYSGGASASSSATATAAVPASSAPLFTLSGLVTEENTNGRAVAGATVEAVDGPNAGKSTTADSNGSYALANLAAGSFSVRATAFGYNASVLAVTVVEHTTLNLRLLRTPVTPTPIPPAPGACAYTIAPNTSGTVGYQGGSFTAAIARTAGTCSWQAGSDMPWITLPGSTSGSGNATLAYVVAETGSLNSRSGTITISWEGGSAQLRVQQGSRPDWECFLSVSKGPENFTDVPSTGGTLTVTVSIRAVPSGFGPQCTATASASPASPWITGFGTVNGGEPPAGTRTFTFTVASNASGTRSGSIVVVGAGRTETLPVTQR